MNASRFHTGSLALTTLLLALAGCGGGGSSATPPPEHVAIGTLAYVDSMCHEDNANGFSASQRLQVVRGDGAPLTVAEIPGYSSPLPPFGLCPGFGANGDGNVSVVAGALQRLGVSPDGSGVVYEVTLQNSLLTALGVPDPLTPEQEGILYVRADGSDRPRRLGDPSREPAQRTVGPRLCGPTARGWANSPRCVAR